MSTILGSSRDEAESGDVRGPDFPKLSLRRSMFDLGLSLVEADDPETSDGVRAGSGTEGRGIACGSGLPSRGCCEVIVRSARVFPGADF